MQKKSKAHQSLPSPANLKRMILAIRCAGLSIKQIEIEPNRIKVLTESSESAVEEELSAFDIWKMKTDTQPSD